MISDIGPTCTQFILGDLASHLGNWAYWNGIRFPARFFDDPVDVATSPVEPGLSTQEIRLDCDREKVPKPWPTLGDVLTVRGQVYEIIDRREDCLGEFSFRLIKQEIGLRHVTSEGQPIATPHAEPGRPSRRAEIVAAFDAAVASKLISARHPVNEIVAAVRPRLGNGTGLSDRTLRKIISELVRPRPAG